MFAIGQTVLFNKSVKGHVILVINDLITVRTSVTGRSIVCKASELKILSEEALPLEAEPIAHCNEQVATEVTVKVHKAPAEGTKLAQAQSIYKVLRATDEFSRKSCIAMFKDQLNMTEAGASTYYNMCQKSLLN